MPITKGLTNRTMCIGPPKQGHLEKRKKLTYARALKFNPNHDKSTGEFTSGSGGGGSTPKSKPTKAPRHLTPAQRAMQAELLRQSRKKIHKVHTPEEGVALILKGENVELQDTKAVHTVLSKLGELAIQSKEKGTKAPNFDPCQITVKGTSLFCAEKVRTKEFPHGIPRIEMPQFKSKHPVPGSEADKLPRDANGEVDATDAFLKHLDEQGVDTNSYDTVLSRKLKASQGEMEGVKVAGMMISKDRDPKKARIVVSGDNYVVDGHHTWAAAVGRDAEDGNLDNDMEMNVVRIGLTMSEIYHLSVAWTKQFGLPAAGVKKMDLWCLSWVRGRRLMVAS